VRRWSHPPSVYGVLDLTGDVHGWSPRLGSSFVVLDPERFDRATFCAGDSRVGPTDIGTVHDFGGGASVHHASTRWWSRGLAIQPYRKLAHRGPALEGPAAFILELDR